MKVNICLLAFILGCNVAQVIIREIIEEKQPITLSCPWSVDGAVTWTRETNGQRVDLLTADKDEIKHIDDRLKRYSSLADKSLHIREINTSDSGRYFCNNEAAADLTVIPSGTTRRVAERTTVTLTCPGDAGGSTWSRDAGDIRHRGRFYVSTVDRTLTVRDVQPGDSGLYYCDGKPAAYLIVIKNETSERGNKTPPTTAAVTPPQASRDTTTTHRQHKESRKKKKKKKGTKTPTATHAAAPPTATAVPAVTPTEPAAPLLWQTVRLVVGILCLIIMVSVTATVWRTARQKERRDRETERHRPALSVCAVTATETTTSC
ncbi:uncharacterized protein LOC143335303 [Chaetodon auriga]|uniref:uncharacterized protein LOC143335303 n=1 Tax=Chaetodon auriga TaxID=39042 RepID=UPI004032A7EB